MRKGILILLAAVSMLVSACASGQVDIPETTERPALLEETSAAETTEGQILPETENTVPAEPVTQTESIEETQDPAEEMLSQSGSFTVRSISLRPAELIPDSGMWASGGIRVYFGRFEGVPTAYRVLASPDTQTVSCESGSLLLDCDTALMQKAFDDNFSRNETQIKIPSEWEGSDIALWLNGSDFYGSSAVFSPLEKAAIADTRLDETPAVYTIGNWTYEDYGAQGHIFLLSAAEADCLYTENAARSKTGSSTSWWLRSSFGHGGNGAGSIHGDGHICNNSITNFGVSVSPAYNVNLSKVLFVSTVGTDKSLALAEAGAKVEIAASRNWKLTLLDTGKAVNVTDGEAVTKQDTAAGPVITVPYTYSGKDVTQISVMITDKACSDSGAQVLYYGALQGISPDSTVGTGTFLLPSDLRNQICGTDYHVYILAEDGNGKYETDYASQFHEITIPSAFAG